jgi:hypothetical protein
MYVFIMTKRRRRRGAVQKATTDTPLPELQALTEKQASALAHLRGLMREDFAE